MTEKQPKDQDQDFDKRVWRSRLKSSEPQL